MPGNGKLLGKFKATAPIKMNFKALTACCVSTADDLDLRGVMPTFSSLIIDSTTAKQK
jgi:hypothetical protein